MRTRILMFRCLAWCVGPPLGLLVAATLGCAASTDQVAPSGPPPAQRFARTPTSSRSPEMARQVQAALDDAARRAGTAVAELKVASVERVTWLDGSLGCPEPGLMYTQALVPGYRIRIEAGGKALDYHANTRGEMQLCPPGRAVAPAAQQPRSPAAGATAPSMRRRRKRRAACRRRAARIRRRPLARGEGLAEAWRRGWASTGRRSRAHRPRR